MRKVILSIVIIAATVLSSCKSEGEKETNTSKTEVSAGMATTDTSFGVRGNCGMCKSTIEKAVNNVTGVTSAKWDVEKKKVEVSFDNSKTDLITIHNAIAESGYDTEKVKGDLVAYEGLPGCCKYDHEMKMNQ